MPEGEISVEPHFVKNFWQGRGTSKPLAIIEQNMPSTLEQTFSIFNGEPAKDGHSYNVSTHYGVGRDGRVWQFVREEDTAWANGKVNNPDAKLDWLSQTSNPNLITISIGYEDTSEGLSEQQYAATLALHKQLLKRWDIPGNETHIVGHQKLDSVDRANSPAPTFPWKRLLQDLGSHKPAQNEVVAAEQELDQYDQAMEVAVSAPQAVNTDETDDLDEYLIEPEPGILQQEVALYEIEKPDDVIPAKSKFEHAENSPQESYDLELDQILAKKDITQPPFEEPELFELDEILAQAAASGASQRAEESSVASSDFKNTFENDFALPNWLNEDVKSDQSEQSSSGYPSVTTNASSTQPDQNQTRNFKLSDYLNAQNERNSEQTQAFSIQPPPSTVATQTFNLPVKEQAEQNQEKVVEHPGNNEQSTTTEQHQIHENAPTLTQNEPLTVQNVIKWVELGFGTIKVELANVRKRPSFEPETVMRTVEEGTKLSFDAYTEGPELYGGTRWLHIARRDGDGWVHSNLVNLENEK